MRRSAPPRVSRTRLRRRRSSRDGGSRTLDETGCRRPRTAAERSSPSRRLGQPVAAGRDRGEDDRVAVPRGPGQRASRASAWAWGRRLRCRFRGWSWSSTRRAARRRHHRGAWRRRSLRPFAAPVSRPATIPAVAEPAATRSSRSATQIQSPGYRPNRRSHACPTALNAGRGRCGRRTRGSSPGPALPAAPHAGRRQAASATGLSLSRAVGRLVGLASSRPQVAPQLAQKRASPGSGWPHSSQAMTGCSPAGRPQCGQKCDPQGRGAPHSHRPAGIRRRAAASISSSSCSLASRPSSSLQRSASRSSRNRSRRYISSISPPRSRSFSSRARSTSRRSRRITPGGGSAATGRRMGSRGAAEAVERGHRPDESLRPGPAVPAGASDYGRARDPIREERRRQHRLPGRRRRAVRPRLRAWLDLERRARRGRSRGTRASSSGSRRSRG